MSWHLRSAAVDDFFAPGAGKPKRPRHVPRAFQCQSPQRALAVGERELSMAGAVALQRQEFNLDSFPFDCVLDLCEFPNQQVSQEV